MSKNTAKEWGRKPRKHEDRIRNLNNSARKAAIKEGKAQS